MLLAVDIGNTKVTMGIFDEGDRPRATLRAGTRPDATPDELSILVTHLARRVPRGVDAIARTVVCSVVPSLTRTFSEFVEAELRHEPVVVSATMDLGLPVAVDDPREVGADRIVNALAARELVGVPAVVVDLGTATNFDCLDAAGRYVGGVIVPGVETSAEDLFWRAARLTKVDLSFPDKVVGRNTRDCLRSGILFGAAGMIDSLLHGVWEELGGTGVTIATGGLAGLIAPRCRRVDRVDVDLTLKGLLLVDRLRKSRETC
jgi:type III pantothenate kinase